MYTIKVRHLVTRARIATGIAMGWWHHRRLLESKRTMGMFVLNIFYVIICLSLGFFFCKNTLGVFHLINLVLGKMINTQQTINEWNFFIVVWSKQNPSTTFNLLILSLCINFHMHSVQTNAHKGACVSACVASSNVIHNVKNGNIVIWSRCDDANSA